MKAQYLYFLPPGSKVIVVFFSKKLLVSTFLHLKWGVNSNSKDKAVKGIMETLNFADTALFLDRAAWMKQHTPDRKTVTASRCSESCVVPTMVKVNLNSLEITCCLL